MTTSLLTRLARRARAIVRRDVLDRETDDEMRFHVEMEAADLARARGLDAAEARRQALVAFGGVSRYREAHREARGTGWLEETMQDVRYAARGLRRSPGFTLSSVSILALGIGATTAAFSAVTSVLLHPEYDRQVIIIHQYTPTSWGTLSVVDFRAIEEQQRSFTDVAAIRWGRSAFSAGPGEPESVVNVSTTSGLFRAFGVRPLRGRFIEPRDEPVGAPPVAVVSHRRAMQSLGGPDAAVGKHIMVEGVDYTVAGVMPPDAPALAGVRADVWTTLQLAPPTRRGPFGLRVIGRLRDGVTPEAAARDLAGISQRIFPLWAAGFQDSTARYNPVPMHEMLLGDRAKMLAVFAAAVALVLLIAIANVASLMLVRAIGRSREVTLRAVLGASRARLGRLLVTESLLLAFIGALAGIGVGVFGLRALIAFGPYMPHLGDARLDARAAVFAAAVALLAGIIVGAYPTLMLLGREPSGGAQGGDRTVGAGRRTHAVRSAFVIAQFALALPLLAVAGLLLNSFVRLQRVDPGFDPRNMLTVDVPLPGSRYDADSLVARYWTQALPLLGEIPGVTAVGLGTSLPPNDQGNNLNNFDLVDKPVSPGSSQPMAPWPSVTREYFSTLGLRLLEGRMFTAADTGGPAPVVIVSRSWAERYFPEGNVVGRRLIGGGCTECPRTTIIGVVSDVRYQGLNGEADAVYVPTSEGWPRQAYLFVRTTGISADLTTSVRSVLRSLDPSLVLDDVASMEERLFESVEQPRNWAVLLGGFAAVALTLAAVGIFGMLSYAVSTRRREIGVRMALGARQNEVVRMVVRRGLGHAVVGTAIGLAAAVVGTRALATMLFEVSASDPTTLASVALILLAVATVACWLPARRAAAIDPAETLRVE